MISVDDIPLQNPARYGRIIQNIADANPENDTWFVNPEDFTDGTYNQEDWQRFNADIAHLRDIYGSKIDELVEVAPMPTEPIDNDYIAVMYGDFRLLFHDDPIDLDYDDEEDYVL